MFALTKPGSRVGDRVTVTVTTTRSGKRKKKATASTGAARRTASVKAPAKKRVRSISTKVKRSNARPKSTAPAKKRSTRKGHTRAYRLPGSGGGLFHATGRSVVPLLTSRPTRLADGPPATEVGTHEEDSEEIPACENADTNNRDEALGDSLSGFDRSAISKVESLNKKLMKLDKVFGYRYRVYCAKNSDGFVLRRYTITCSVGSRAGWTDELARFKPVGIGPVGRRSWFPKHHGVSWKYITTHDVDLIARKVQGHLKKDVRARHIVSSETAVPKKRPLPTRETTSNPSKPAQEPLSIKPSTKRTIEKKGLKPTTKNAPKSTAKPAARPVAKPTKTTDSEAELSPASDVVSLPIGSIGTDPKRFQPRDDFSIEKVKQIVANYNAAKFDPIVVWRASEGIYYVLAGHHRFEAAKELKLKKVPARVLVATEEEAQQFAWTSNNLGRQQTPAENAKYLRRLLEQGKSDKEIKDECRNLYERSCRTVWLLAQLDPDGLAVRMMNEFGRGSDGYSDAETMAKWVGSFRESLGYDISRSHENEIYQFLRENYKTSGRKLRSESEFTGFLDRQWALRFPMNAYSEGEPLNLNNDKSAFFREHDERVREAERELLEAKRDRDRKLAETVQRGVDDETRARVMRSFEDRVLIAQRALIEVKDSYDQVSAAAQAQESLFGLGDEVEADGMRFNVRKGEDRWYVSFVRGDGYRFPLDPASKRPTAKDLGRYVKLVRSEGFDRQLALLDNVGDTLSGAAKPGAGQQPLDYDRPEVKPLQHVTALPLMQYAAVATHIRSFREHLTSNRIAIRMFPGGVVGVISRGHAGYSNDSYHQNATFFDAKGSKLDYTKRPKIHGTVDSIETAWPGDPVTLAPSMSTEGTEKYNTWGKSVNRLEIYKRAILGKIEIKNYRSFNGMVDSYEYDSTAPWYNAAESGSYMFLSELDSPYNRISSYAKESDGSYRMGDYYVRLAQKPLTEISMPRLDAGDWPLQEPTATIVVPDPQPTPVPHKTFSIVPVINVTTPEGYNNTIVTVEPRLNKNDSIETIREQISKGSRDTLVRIERIIGLSHEDYTLFVETLLNDQPWITGGGTSLPQNVIDFLPADLAQAYHDGDSSFWSLLERKDKGMKSTIRSQMVEIGTLVYDASGRTGNDRNPIIINGHGHNYARYAYLPKDPAAALRIAHSGGKFIPLALHGSRISQEKDYATQSGGQLVPAALNRMAADMVERIVAAKNLPRLTKDDVTSFDLLERFWMQSMTDGFMPTIDEFVSQQWGDSGRTMLELWSATALPKQSLNDGGLS